MPLLSPANRPAAAHTALLCGPPPGGACPTAIAHPPSPRSHPHTGAPAWPAHVCHSTRPIPVTETQAPSTTLRVAKGLGIRANPRPHLPASWLLYTCTASQANPGTFHHHTYIVPKMPSVLYSPGFPPSHLPRPSHRSLPCTAELPRHSSAPRAECGYPGPAQGLASESLSPQGLGHTEGHQVFCGRMEGQEKRRDKVGTEPSPGKASDAGHGDCKARPASSVPESGPPTHSLASPNPSEAPLPTSSSQRWPRPLRWVWHILPSLTWPLAGLPVQTSSVCACLPASLGTLWVTRVRHTKNPRKCWLKE